jgi:hypothetical protein
MRLLQARGVERRFGRLLYGRLRAHGLVEVGAEGRLFMWQSGSAGVSLMRANFEQLRGALIGARYVTEQEFDQDIAHLDDPDFMAPSPHHVDSMGAPTISVTASPLLNQCEFNPTRQVRLVETRLASNVETNAASVLTCALTGTVRSGCYTGSCYKESVRHRISTASAAISTMRNLSGRAFSLQ